ncbi:MAG: DUF2971 domain-containing protein [Alphaproteobacteria bacterium]|nr:DUF2971 domain-containing protein [Alphaproteobacteria bacterium]MBU0796889.1 DUF2971 domain-containing protein [Alphaproteobacteria bacterium]MBU0886467.1 DUF2971 domain-containing protein [Alphaproteobacteria bacterium]MBU1812310.1 DUF2971 domain-containing protein [Alphaproteobacteria bacterium]
MDATGSRPLAEVTFLRRYTSIAAVIDILRRKELPLLDPQSWDDRNDRYFMSLYKESGELGGLYGLCAATCKETYHHWRVFTNAADGACIEIRREPLEERLQELPGVSFGEVDYLVLGKVENLGPGDRKRLPFVKRWGFEPESEYRIIAETTEAQRPALSIDFPLSLIGRIHLNPWLPAPIADSLKATLREIPGCSKLPIARSQLIESGRWKVAGDTVIRRPAALRRKLAKPKGAPKG